jgi:hypothetical protein
MFSYDRKPHLEYLNNLIKNGTYEEYQEELTNLRELNEKLDKDGMNTYVIIDQSDNIYWGDIMFVLNDSNVSFNAEKICSILKKHGITTSLDSLYYNTAIKAIMYTAIAIKTKGPEFYPDYVMQNKDFFLVR